jgi:hypothetical protein
MALGADSFDVHAKSAPRVHNIHVDIKRKCRVFFETPKWKNETDSQRATPVLKERGN